MSFSAAVERVALSARASRERSFRRLLEIMAQARHSADYRGETCWVVRRLYLQGRLSEFGIISNPQSAKRRRMEILCEVKPTRSGP